MSELSYFLPAIVLLLCLIGIHCYLGLHVLMREVIFIDLSLAQVAAMGYVVSLILGFELGTWGSYGVALLHTMGGALLFAYCKRVEHEISQESLIGITYAFAASMVVLLLNNVGHGMEHVKNMLVGRILWVDWHDVIKVVVLYSIVGLIHYFYRQRFFSLSKKENIQNAIFWDFIFYALFGVVITSSVGSAGLLLVFSLLIVPAQISSVLFKAIKNRLFFGWGLGLLISVIGLFTSLKVDLPTGAVTVFFFTATAIVFTFIRAFLAK
ncbi:ABC 3 transport family protein [Bacteriovorax sp. BSW11_IV]|uniref:metal ABC transporter permease n=1 Tax=Bacteriovorax sp. BSW11_IV TaxID=1353529 RepID=UPI000389EE03|nr:metal ABC transporter permease [Bacteriovorax sp. BSW11_IV]EQC42934.1 ABC 3 transport family protein [Bacteriovorax sp. BSW11_IV]